MTATLPLSRTKPAGTVLLAEDGIITQDILRLLLTQRGHTVDVVDDGEQALAALQRGNYDTALVDFHLPKMDGLRVVSQFKATAPAGTAKTHFIGITGDIEGLLAHPDNCETFDLVLAKPIDIVHLCNVLENFDTYMSWTRELSSGSLPLVPADNLELERQVDIEKRRHRRLALGQGTTIVALKSGELHDCRVLDLSLSGAALQLSVRPAIGEYVRVGRTEGRVVRHIDQGIAVVFVKTGN
jgi:CheY-like chemotaxis protein